VPPAAQRKVVSQTIGNRGPDIENHHSFRALDGGM